MLSSCLSLLGALIYFLFAVTVPVYDPSGLTPLLFSLTSRNKYNEWVLCLKNNEKDEAKCFLPRFNMRELCPGEWVEKWDADRDGDKFAGLQVDDAEH